MYSLSLSGENGKDRRQLAVNYGQIISMKKSVRLYLLTRSLHRPFEKITSTETVDSHVYQLDMFLILIILTITVIKH